VGGLLASSFIVQLTLEEYLATAVVWFCMHIIAVYVGYVIGLRDVKI
jgi:hypothetical protein